MFETIKDLIMNPIVNVSPEEIGTAIHGGMMWLGVILTVTIQLALLFVILAGAGVILLSVAMRTPLRPYLVDLLGFDTVRTYKRYKAIKKANRK